MGVEHKDEWLRGASGRYTWYLPHALVQAIREAATEDGYKSVSAYISDLLVAALRARQAERTAERKLPK